MRFVHGFLQHQRWSVIELPRISCIPLCNAQILLETTMTTISMSRETVRNNGLSATPGLMGQFKTYLARSKAERQLRQLDDHLLADIGLKRADISKAVWMR
jgi:uncharacterized protein YjiS (DUF1127 family)